MEEIKMEIPPDYVFVPGVRTCIARIAYNFGFDDRESYQIETVVDEICINAIEHGSKGKDKKVKIGCSFDKGKIELIVRDSGGREFNAKKVFQRNRKFLQEELSKGIIGTARRGKGLIIVQKLVDRLGIKTDKNGTTVRIIKKAIKMAPGREG